MTSKITKADETHVTYQYYFLDGEKSFLESMLDYMPRWHREFVFYVREGPSIREYGRLC